MGDGGGQARGLGWRLGGLHRLRGGGGQRCLVPLVVGDDDPHLDGLTLVAGQQGISGARSPRDVRIVAQPLIAVGDVGQPVRVGDARGVRRQHLAHLGRAGDGRFPGCGRVGSPLLLDSKANRIRGRTGQRCLVPRVVDDGDPHLDGLALVVGHQRIGGIRLARDVRIGGSVIGNPLVGVGRVVQPVVVGNAGSVRREQLPNLGRPADGRFAGGPIVGRRRDCSRSLTDQGFPVVGVVGEGHTHLDGFALVGC